MAFFSKCVGTHGQIHGFLNCTDKIPDKDVIAPMYENYVVVQIYPYTSQNPKVFWNLGSILNSWVCFCFFGMGFGFLQVFWDSGTCSGFWEVFCSYEPQ